MSQVKNVGMYQVFTMLNHPKMFILRLLSSVSSNCRSRHSESPGGGPVTKMPSARASRSGSVVARLSSHQQQHHPRHRDNAGKCEIIRKVCESNHVKLKFMIALVCSRIMYFKNLNYRRTTSWSWRCSSPPTLGPPTSRSASTSASSSTPATRTTIARNQIQFSIGALRSKFEIVGTFYTLNPFGM